MKRPTLHVFTRHESVKQSICQVLKLFEPGGVKHVFNSRDNAHVMSFLEEVTSVLDSEPPDVLPNTAVIYAATAEDSLNPLLTQGGLARLILTYPEVYWIILYADLKAFDDVASDPLIGSLHFVHITEIVRCIDLLVKHQEGFRPLFDQGGLRNRIRLATKNTSETAGEVKTLSSRTEYALSIDEEETYAYLHAYLAYKTGHMTSLINTKHLMDNFIGVTKIDQTFEDIYLNFPDRTVTTNSHLSNLRQRDELYPPLKEVHKRIFVTSGHTHTTWQKENTQYLDELKSQGKTIKILYKPSGGIYDILGKAGLLREYVKNKSKELKQSAPGPETINPDSHDHSAPGQLLVISETLIDRADKMLNAATTVRDCIYGATLALEAQELLMYRTPATSLEAIAVRHKLEVKAECMFYGMEYNIDVKNRLEELKREIDAVSCWFHPSAKKRASLNALMTTVTEIMRLFRDYGQFDEEQVCTRYIRTLNREWSLRQPGIKNMFSYLIYPLRWYAESLLNSFSIFFIAIILWPLIFGVTSYFLELNYGALNSKVFWKQLINAIITFYGLQPNFPPENQEAAFFTSILILSGFLHLGIFISYMYTLISRK